MTVILIVDVPGFSIGGQTYPNHGLVLISDIGEDNSDPGNQLHCVSDLHTCCSGLSSFRGEFDFPDGTQVPTMGAATQGYYRNRGLSDRIFLNRQSSGTTQGLFRCRIVTSQTSVSLPAEFYIGVYDTNSG